MVRVVGRRLLLMVAWDLLKKGGHSVYTRCQRVVVKAAGVGVEK